LRENSAGVAEGFLPQPGDVVIGNNLPRKGHLLARLAMAKNQLNFTQNYGFNLLYFLPEF